MRLRCVGCSGSGKSSGVARRQLWPLRGQCAAWFSSTAHGGCWCLCHGLLLFPGVVNLLAMYTSLKFLALDALLLAQGLRRSHSECGCRLSLGGEFCLPRVLCAPSALRFSTSSFGDAAMIGSLELDSFAVRPDHDSRFRSIGRPEIDCNRDEIAGHMLPNNQRDLVAVIQKGSVAPSSRTTLPQPVASSYVLIVPKVIVADRLQQRPPFRIRAADEHQRQVCLLSRRRAGPR